MRYEIHRTGARMFLSELEDDHYEIRCHGFGDVWLHSHKVKRHEAASTAFLMIKNSLHRVFEEQDVPAALAEFEKMATAFP